MFSSFRGHEIDFLRSSPKHTCSARPAGTPTAGPGALRCVPTPRSHSRLHVSDIAPTAPVTSPFSAQQVRWEIHFCNSFMILAHEYRVHTSLADAVRRLFASSGRIATGRSSAHPTERSCTIDLVRGALIAVGMSPSEGSVRCGSALPGHPLGMARDSGGDIARCRPSLDCVRNGGTSIGTDRTGRQAPPANVKAVVC